MVPALAVLIATLLSSGVHASCAGRLSNRIPHDGALDVPVDVAPVLTSSRGHPSVVVRAVPSGNPVAAAVEWVDGAGTDSYGFVRLVERLSPLTEYEFQVGGSRSWFTTGTRSDVAPAAVEEPTVTVETGGRREVVCGDTMWPSRNGWTRVEVATRSALDAAYLELNVGLGDGTEHRVVGDLRGAVVDGSYGECAGGSLLAVRSADSATIAWRAVSWSGIAGAWSVTVPVSIPRTGEPVCARAASEPDRACSGCGSGTAGGLALALAATAWLRQLRATRPHL